MKKDIDGFIDVGIDLSREKEIVVIDPENGGYANHLNQLDDIALVGKNGTSESLRQALEEMRLAANKVAYDKSADEATVRVDDHLTAREQGLLHRDGGQLDKASWQTWADAIEEHKQNTESNTSCGIGEHDRTSRDERQE